jgi:hypothetical protein
MDAANAVVCTCGCGVQDRERLLAVIESGFGTLDAFNTLVSRLFDQSYVQRTPRNQSSVLVSRDLSNEPAHEGGILGEQALNIDQAANCQLDLWKQTASGLKLRLTLKDLILQRLGARCESFKDELLKLGRALQEERAAKIVLQQDVVLQSARRAASKRRLRISGVMIGTGFLSLAVGFPLLIQHLYGLLASMRESFWGGPAHACFLGFALIIMAALPTDDTMIRVCSLVAFLGQAVNILSFGVYPLLTFTGVHRPKYDSPVAGMINVWLAVVYVVIDLVTLPMLFSILRFRRGAKTTSLGKVMNGTVSTFGPAIGIAVMLLSLPVVWVASQPSSSFRLSTPIAYHRLWTIVRATYGTWGAVTFIAWFLCVLYKVPWDTHPVVPSLLAVATSLLTLAAIGLSVPVRKRMHAWLGRVGTTAEVQAAAGVAALVGTLRPAKALALAKERFCALPFDVLHPIDLTTNADTGLNQKSVPMQLGQCDAFISHVRKATLRDAAPVAPMHTEPRVLTRCVAVMVGSWRPQVCCAYKMGGGLRRCVATQSQCVVGVGAESINPRSICASGFAMVLARSILVEQ